MLNKIKDLLYPFVFAYFFLLGCVVVLVALSGTFWLIAHIFGVKIA